MKASRRSRLLRRLNPLHREDGQAAFEFLLVLPFFVLFLLMTVDLGVMMYEFVSVANGAREGARYGAVNCAPDPNCNVAAVQTRVVQRSGGIVAGGDVTVDRVNRGGSAAATDKGDSIVVHISHDYSFLFIPGVTVNITSCADMRVEANAGAGVPAGSAC